MYKLAWKRRMGEEGEMGVGTLLIFIAMILVAAVASGVLVQTAYKLQQQAESTGDEALQDVATGLKVLGVWGTTDVTPRVDNIYLKVALTAGSPGIDLENVVIEVTQTIGGGASSEVSLAYGATASSTEFAATEIRDMAPSTSAVMMTAGDIFQIQILLNSTGINMPLDPQEQLTVVLIPKHGVPTYLEITAPSVLEASSVLVLK